MNKKLLILGCSSLKRGSDELLPALDRYDGPAFRVVRKFLRNYQWPEDISIAVLSAKYGLIGILKRIANYDKTMDATEAMAMASASWTELSKWAPFHNSIYLCLGKNYLPAVESAITSLGMKHQVFEGGIGKKLNELKTFLSNSTPPIRLTPNLKGGSGSYQYFVPLEGNSLNAAVRFESDTLTSSSDLQRSPIAYRKTPRIEKTGGVMVNLVQQGTDSGALSPPMLRKHLRLPNNQYVFGTCGAIKRSNETLPNLTAEQAVALYESYGFDLGSSPDHMPKQSRGKSKETTQRTNEERQNGIDIARENARLFIESANSRRVHFTPVGTMPMLMPQQFDEAVHEYYEMGYRHLVLGGFCGQDKRYIKEVVTAVAHAADRLPERPWIHIRGVIHSQLLALFQQLKIDSFDRINSSTNASIKLI